VENHGLDSRDDVKVSKELIVKEIKGLDVVPKITEQEGSEENVDDHPVRGNRSLSDIYQRFNMDVLEPADHEEALNHLKWKKDEEGELYMIEKNNTLVDIPPNRKVIVVYDGSINKNKAKFVRYSNIDWGGSLEDMKSTSWYCKT